MKWVVFRHSYYIRSEDFMTMLTVLHLYSMIMVGFGIMRHSGNLDDLQSHLWALTLSAILFVVCLASSRRTANYVRYHKFYKWFLPTVLLCTIVTLIGLTAYHGMLSSVALHLTLISFVLTGFPCGFLILLCLTSIAIGLVFQGILLKELYGKYDEFLTNETIKDISTNLHFGGLRNNKIIFIDMGLLLMQVIGGIICYNRSWKLGYLLSRWKNKVAYFMGEFKTLKDLEATIFQYKDYNMSCSEQFSSIDSKHFYTITSQPLHQKMPPDDTDTEQPYQHDSNNEPELAEQGVGDALPKVHDNVPCATENSPLYIHNSPQRSPTGKRGENSGTVAGSTILVGGNEREGSLREDICTSKEAVLPSDGGARDSPPVHGVRKGIRGMARFFKKGSGSSSMSPSASSTITSITSALYARSSVVDDSFADEESFSEEEEDLEWVEFCRENAISNRTIGKRTYTSERIKPNDDSLKFVLESGQFARLDHHLRRGPDKSADSNSVEESVVRDMTLFINNNMDKINEDNTILEHYKPKSGGFMETYLHKNTDDDATVGKSKAPRIRCGVQNFHGAMENKLESKGTGGTNPGLSRSIHSCPARGAVHLDPEHLRKEINRLSIDRSYLFTDPTTERIRKTPTRISTTRGAPSHRADPSPGCRLQKGDNTTGSWQSSDTTREIKNLVDEIRIEEDDRNQYEAKSLGGVDASEGRQYDYKSESERISSPSRVAAAGAEEIESLTPEVSSPLLLDRELPRMNYVVESTMGHKLEYEGSPVSSFIWNPSINLQNRVPECRSSVECDREGLHIGYMSSTFSSNEVFSSSSFITGLTGSNRRNIFLENFSTTLKNPFLRMFYLLLPKCGKRLMSSFCGVYELAKGKRKVMHKNTWNNPVLVPPTNKLELFSCSLFENWYVEWMHDFNSYFYSITGTECLLVCFYSIFTFGLLTLRHYLTLGPSDSIKFKSGYRLFLLILRFIIQPILSIICISPLFKGNLKRDARHTRRFYWIMLALCLLNWIFACCDIYSFYGFVNTGYSVHNVLVLELLLTQTSVLLCIRGPTFFMLYILYFFSFIAVHIFFDPNLPYRALLTKIFSQLIVGIGTYCFCSRPLDTNRRLLFSMYVLPYLLYLKQLKHNYDKIPKFSIDNKSYLSANTMPLLSSI